MSTRRTLYTLLAVLALGVAACWHLGARVREDARPEALKPLAASDHAPSLRGRALASSPAPSVVADPEPEPSSTDPETRESEPPSGQDAAGRARTLVAAIRRDVEPEFWDEHLPAGVAVLEARKHIVIARAPEEVLEAIREYLDGLHAPKVTVTLPPPEDWGVAVVAGTALPDVEPAVQAEAVEALRALFRKVLDQTRRLDRGLAAARQGQWERAEEAVGAVLAVEEDHTFATDLARVVHGRADADVARRVSRLRSRWSTHRNPLTLADWIHWWPSAATRQAAFGHWKRAGFPDLGVRGIARRDVLERGSVSVALEDASLYAVLRALQIETFVDVYAEFEVERKWTTGMTYAVQDRPLQVALDRVLETLPEGHAWRQTTRGIRLVLRDAPPPYHIRYYDLSDQDLDVNLPSAAPRGSAAEVAVPPVVENPGGR